MESVLPKRNETTTALNDSRSVSRAEFVYSRLREEISHQSLRPGDRLREVEVSDRLEVSRTPVREALKRLEAEGLIETNSARGLCVTTLSPARVMELYAMRELLAGAAARFAATQASAFEVQSMQNMVERMALAQTAEEAAEGNRRLHMAIVHAAHNAYLTSAFNVLSNALILLGKTTYLEPGRMQSGLEENRAIVDAIASHDPAAAEKAAREHIYNAGQVRLQIMFATQLK